MCAVPLNPMPADPSDRSQELQTLLLRLRPRILELLRTHDVPEESATEIVHDTFMALAVRWGRVPNREAWLIGTLEARCRSFASRRDGDRPDPAPHTGPDSG